MSDAADAYLAHLGVEVGDELKHYGKKGMKWGVRNDRPSSGSGGGARKEWTDDQKRKARNIAVTAGVIAVGAAFVAAHVYANGADARQLAAIRAPGGRLPAGQVRLGASLPSQKGTYQEMSGFLKGVVRDGKIQRAAREGVMSDAYRKTSAGKNFVDNLMKEQGGTKLAMDPALRDFIKDAPNRILQDQKGWSNSLGKSLSSIQKEDAAFMADYIKNNLPKALGA